MKKNKIIQLLFFGFILLLNAVSQKGYSQFKIPEKPTFQTSVYDYANLLQANQKAQLEEKLIKYSDSTSTQIVIITVDKIDGEDIGILTPRWAQEWGIGDKKFDNGILILIAKTERKIWIAPGYGVEDRLVAGINGEIIRNSIRPEFKNGKYYEGLNKGADAIFEVLKGKYKATRKTDSKTTLPIVPIIIIVLILLFIYFKNKNNGGHSGNGSGGINLMDIILLSSLGRNSGGSSFGGSSSSGGGGFGGGFGGGGFSGGGAGGDW